MSAFCLLPPEPFRCRGRSAGRRRDHNPAVSGRMRATQGEVFQDRGVELETRVLGDFSDQDQGDAAVF